MSIAWLALHDRIHTAEILAKKNWPHNENCAMCLCHFETTVHLLTQCNYTKALWNAIAPGLDLPNYQHLRNLAGLEGWIEGISQTGNKAQKRRKIGSLFYFWWNLWKERNRRIFNNQEKSVPQLASLILQDVQQFARTKITNLDEEDS